MKKFFDNHPCITANVIGAVVTVIFCLAEPLRVLPGIALMLLLEVILESKGIFLIYILLVNIFAAIAVSKGKIKTGILLSIFGGSIGSLLAETFENSGSNALKIISAVCIWVCICIAVSGYIYLENDFRLFP